MITKKVYLDTFALVKIAADAGLRQAARKYFDEDDRELVVGALNLVEVYPHQRRWSEVADLIASVPFCIAQNPDQVADVEVASYPEAITLPVVFRSSDHRFSRTELGDAIEKNMRIKVASFSRNFRGRYEETLEALLEDRDSFPPDSGCRHSTAQKWIFLQKSVLAMLSPRHLGFLKKLLASQEQIRIELFRSVYIQALAVYLEYHVQKKKGKLSDVGDILQLALLPYMDEAVLDNERNDLVMRINREWPPPEELQSCTWSEFLVRVGAA